MAQQRGLIRQARGPRRLTSWGFGPGNNAEAQLSASSAVIVGAGVTFGSAGTVVRIRGRFGAYLVSFTSAGDGYIGAVGIGLAATAAFDAGIASLPTPITEEGWDGWLWHSFFGVHGGVAAASENAGHIELVIDSKAMRKVSGDMVVFAALEVVESGTAVMNISLNSRMLLKEG